MSEHHPDCYQSTGVPDDLPAGLCDCRVLRMLDDAVGAVIPPVVTDPPFPLRCDHQPEQRACPACRKDQP